MTLDARSIVITGACGDLGRSLAGVFAGEGTQLALCDLEAPDSAEPVLTELTRRGATTFYLAVDVSDAAAMVAFMGHAAQKFGRVDVCIVNAGIVERGALLDLEPAVWRRTLDVNLTGGFLTAQAAAREMVRAQRPGHIVFISSWVQDVPRANIGAYCASKGGLKMLAKCLALELAPKGIRVNLVAPGWVDAGLTRRNLDSHPERRAQIEAQIPLGRLASADEIARTVRMLCSDDAGYLTGTTILVDGGASLGVAAK